MTLHEYIITNYPGYAIEPGEHAPIDTDVSHGVDVVTYDNKAHGGDKIIELYPYILWDDGSYKPCRFWSLNEKITLIK